MTATQTHSVVENRSGHLFIFDIFGPPHISIISQFCLGLGGLRESELVQSDDDSSTEPKVVL